MTPNGEPENAVEDGNDQGKHDDFGHSTSAGNVGKYPTSCTRRFIKNLGIEGTLSFPSTLIEYVDDEPSPLYDQLELRVSNLRI
jgi:hypothetical protein